MKKQYLILITVAVILLVLYSKKNKTEPVDVIKPGDKGNDVLGVQSALTSMTGVKLGNMGVYDNETLAAVRYYMKGSEALVDEEKGYISDKFASDLSLILKNAKNNHPY